MPPILNNSHHDARGRLSVPRTVTTKLVPHPSCYELVTNIVEKEMTTRAETSANGAAVRSMSPHRHHPPPLPLKTGRRRSSFTLPISLPSPDFVGSIASGAHYSGAIPITHSTSGEHVKHRRALSASADDPSVEEAYREVMEDLKEVNPVFSMRRYTNSDQSDFVFGICAP